MLNTSKYAVLISSISSLDFPSTALKSANLASLLVISSVKIISIDLNTPKGPIIEISGADLLDGTPIYDIKPYLAYTDSHPEASSGFALTDRAPRSEVVISEELLHKVPEEHRASVIDILAEDPRPGYQDDSSRVYVLEYANFEIAFRASDGKIVVDDIIFK